MEKTISNFKFHTFSGLYQTRWDLDFNAEDDECGDISDYDARGWLNSIAAEYAKDFCRLLGWLGIRAVAGHITTWSPSDYNYMTDEISCDLTISNWNETRAMLLRWMDENRSEVAQHIRDRWHSRNGFVSLFSDDFYDWRSDLEDEKDGRTLPHGRRADIAWLICLFAAMRLARAGMTPRESDDIFRNLDIKIYYDILDCLAPEDYVTNEENADE